MSILEDLERQQRKSKAVHHAALVLLEEDPSLLDVMLTRIPKKRAKHGDIHGWLDEWEEILRDRSLDAFRRVAEGSDNHSSDLRSVTPIGAILPDELRRKALESVT